VELMFVRCGIQASGSLGLSPTSAIQNGCPELIVSYMNIWVNTSRQNGSQVVDEYMFHEVLHLVEIALFRKLETSTFLSNPPPLQGFHDYWLIGIEFLPLTQ
jgi:hypothetical protein